jgi:hypothetical protein
MQTIKMTGRGALVITIDKMEFRPKNGILELPAHLEQHAVARGFRRMTAAEIAERNAERDEAIATTDVATETLELPAGHPEQLAIAARAAKVGDEIAANAEAAKGTTGSAKAPAGVGA